jgi:hypothetical protein
MSDGIRVDVVALRTASASFGATGQQLGTSVTGLDGTVTGSGNPWGSDEGGSIFGAVYVEVLTHALDCYRSMADQLLETSENLSYEADAYEQIETENADLFNRMELPGGSAAAI